MIIKHSPGHCSAKMYFPRAKDSIHCPPLFPPVKIAQKKQQAQFGCFIYPAQDINTNAFNKRIQNGPFSHLAGQHAKLLASKKTLTVASIKVL